MSEEPSFSQFDDSALISARRELRGELERLPPRIADRAELTALRPDDHRD